MSDYPGEFGREGQAKKIWDEISKLTPDKARRWPFELIQNAHDAPQTGHSLRIRIACDEAAKTVTFSHTGGIFDEKPFYALLLQHSTKLDPVPGDEDAATGRWGTGFIVTYLLSRRVRVTGFVRPDHEVDRPRAFNLLLDRAAPTFAELRQKIERLLEQAQATKASPPVEVPAGDFNTSFCYEAIDESGWAAVEAGIADLLRSAPYVIAFNPRIQEIEVACKGVRFFLESRTPGWHGDHAVEEVQVREIRGGGEVAHRLLVRSAQKTAVAIPIEEQPSGQLTLVPLDDKVPSLFCAFPLVGSEVLRWPFVVNSRAFWPSENRAGIDLTSRLPERPDYPRINKGLLEAAASNAVALARALAKADVNGTLRLALLHSVNKAPDWLDSKWYKSFLENKLVGCIYKEKIAQLEKRRCALSPVDTRNPPLVPQAIVDEKAIHANLVYVLFPGQVIRRQDIDVGARITYLVQICRLGFR